MEGISSYVLGLDLGVSSVGWAAISQEDSGRPGRFLRSGVRIFEPGMEGDISSGRAESRNKKRRDARLVRRQIDRRKRRKQKLLHCLQKLDLLPPGEPAEFMPGLDRRLLEKFIPAGSDAVRFAHMLPYALRKHALDAKLEPHELGRALYHLAQRRGYNSNRKADAIEDTEERGKVLSGISELDQKIAHAHARTLGEYFAGLHPETDRIRSRWTSRKMYIDEFNAIMDAQSAFHPTLSPEVRNELFHCVFDQRKLKSVSHLIGKCELEPGQTRGPWLRLEAQRFRLLQKLNDTRIIYSDGTASDLTREQIDLLKNVLERQETLKFTQARKLLKITDRSAKFNWEEGGEKEFKGNTTAAKLCKVFGERWFELSDDDRRRIVEDIHSFENDAALEKRGRERWGLSKEAAVLFSKVSLEPDFCRLSLKAIRKLLPMMEDGVPYATALKETYGEFLRRTSLYNELPPVQQFFPSLLNPVVNRVLTEVRKVVNGIVREFGKPAAIRIELARDMKKTKKQRQEITARNRKNETKRSKARDAVIAEMGIAEPARDDIVKFLLAEECEWECPYSGRKITPRLLFGEHPQFDIEHIIPFSRSLDSSFVNKTLCYHEENRAVKGNRTPWEAYGGNSAAYDTIIQRVKNFRGDAAREKQRRFLLQDAGDIDDWASEQLNDTRYATVLAGKYLGLLYGGREDDTGKQRIFAAKGGTTGYLRAVWKLNAILSDGNEKSRDDHRHHAVDAIAVALTTPETIRMLSTAAANARLEQRHLFARTPEPWPGFWQQAKDAIASVKVSHRPRRKVSGPLHKEQICTCPRPDGNGKQCVHIRVPLSRLTQKQIENDDIVDPAVREAVRLKLAELGGETAKFTEAANHPVLRSKDGTSSRPIHSVRVRQNVAVLRIGPDDHTRYAASGSNHHMEIFDCKDDKGRPKWDAEVVTMFEAMRRLKAREPIVRKDHGPGKGFVCSITSGDMATIQDGGEEKLMVLSSVWVEQGGSKRVQYYSHTDAAAKKKMPKPSLSTLREVRFQKVTVSPLGEIRPAND